MSSIDTEANAFPHPRKSYQSTESQSKETPDAMSYEKWLKILPDFTDLCFTDQRLKRKHISYLQKHSNGYYNDALV